MSRHRDMVAEFHTTFRLPTETEPTTADADTRKLRIKLLCEEVVEFMDAVQGHNMIEMADALADILYVTYGAALAFGIDIDGAMSAVHHSNMTKLWSNQEIADLPAGAEIGQVVTVGPDAHIVYWPDGKVKKSPSFEEPKLWEVLYPPRLGDEGRFERQG